MVIQFLLPFGGPLMKSSTWWVLVLLFALGAATLPACSNREKPLTPEDKSKIDDDMRKAIEANKAKVGS